MTAPRPHPRSVSCYLPLRHLVTQRGCTHGAGRKGDRGVPPGLPWRESGERGVLAPVSAAGDSCHRWLGWIPDNRRVRRAARLSPYLESVGSPATTNPDRLPREEEQNRQR